MGIVNSLSRIVIQLSWTILHFNNDTRFTICILKFLCQGISNLMNKHAENAINFLRVSAR